MGRTIGLNSDLTFRILPASASCHLFYHIKSPFSRTEIREIDYRVSINHTHHTDIPEVKPFCHHLCTHKNLRLTTREIIYNILVTVLIPRGIKVKTCNGNSRETGINLLLDTFCAITKHFNSWLLAGWAYIRNCIRSAAIMT